MAQTACLNVHACSKFHQLCPSVLAFQGFKVKIFSGFASAIQFPALPDRFKFQGEFEENKFLLLDYGFCLRRKCAVCRFYYIADGRRKGFPLQKRVG